MKKIFRVYLSILVLLVCGMMTGAVNLPQKYVIDGDKFFPEGIAYYPFTGDFFVSSRFDGTIIKGNVKTNKTSAFLPGGQDGRKMAVGMKLDSRGRLFVSGAMTGHIFVYNVHNKKLLAKFATGVTPSFVNDAVITKNGDVYFTDSGSPFLYKVTANLKFSKWLNLKNTVVKYEQGTNFNGIVATPDGKYLIAVQSNNGKLFRISTVNKQVIEIKVSGNVPLFGDGLLLKGDKLIIAQNRKNIISAYHLSNDFSEARYISEITHPEFSFPTTLAADGNDLLVVNGQLHKLAGGEPPALPFAVLRVKEPAER